MPINCDWSKYFMINGGAAVVHFLLDNYILLIVICHTYLEFVLGILLLGQYTQSYTYLQK